MPNDVYSLPEWSVENTETTRLLELCEIEKRIAEALERIADELESIRCAEWLK